MNIIKRSGREEIFDSSKIKNAVKKANVEVSTNEQLTDEEIDKIVDNVTIICHGIGRAPSVEEIQDLVENQIMATGKFNVARRYITYRYKRALVRQANTTDQQIMSLIEGENEEAIQENANKNPIVVSVMRDYMAGEVSKDISSRFLLPKEILEAHKEGIVHFHDMDYYLQRIHNCTLINLQEMLWYGTVISGTMIERPKSFSTACNVATQIVAQVASCQYGGQSISLAHLSPFVDISRQKYRKVIMSEMENAGITCTDDQIKQLVEERVREEVKRGIQMIQYQVITLMTTNGQAPFITVYMNINEAPEGQAREDLALCIEEMLKQRILGVKNEKGVYVTTAFPKLIYVLDENNIRKGTPYFYLTELSAKCSAKRLVPDYISAKVMRELKNGDVYTCMGCRSFLTPDRMVKEGVGNIAKAKGYVPGEHRYYGRFNQGVVTINLVDVALSSQKNEKDFWNIFDERLELCHRALRLRHERLLGTRSDVAPILWQHGAIARLEPGEKIDKLLYGGYSTLSLGYAGLFECVKYMKDVSHTSDEAKGFALEVMQHMNDACAKWKAAENIDYSVYGTPIESTTYKFAKCLQRRFGKIKDVTDHNYITNSYHVNVREEIDAFSKLSFEAEFQRLSPGGAISYVEVPNMQNNIEAVLAIIEHIYENIMYAEINTKSDYCQVCGFDGEIQIVEDENGKLIWECPNCGNHDHDKMNVARRVCGYISTNDFNQGRMGDVKDRVLHI